MSDDATRSAPPPADLTRSAGEPPTASTDPPKDLSTATFPSPADAIDPPPGFVVEGELGVGGMGVVYLARQVGLKRPVALKLVKGGGTIDAKALIRFLAEAEAVAAIRHKNVVEVYQYGDHNGRPYLALELCPGGDLTALRGREAKATAADFRRIAELMAGVADGVNAAHALGIVHRDLKPHNILLAADGTPKVADFGLAKRGVGSDLTQSGAVMGTPAYMAPEQAGGGTKFVGPEADVWAMGVMLYELCCGERPIDTSGPVLEALAKVAKADVPPLRKLAPAVPPDLALIAHKCLHADPRDRYPTAGVLAADLRNWLDGKPITARPAGVIEQAVKWAKRNKRLAFMGAAVLLTMALATAVSLGFGLEANEQRKQAVGAAIREADEKQAAIEARNDLANANEKTERALARALIANFISNHMYGSDEERSTFHWDSVRWRGTPFGRVLLEEVADGQGYSYQSEWRTSAFLHSLVGLDAKQKLAAAQVFGKRIRDSATSARLKSSLLWVAASGEYWDGSATELIEQLVSAYDMGTFAYADETAAEPFAICAARQPDKAGLLAELMLKQFVSADQSNWTADECEGYFAIVRRIPDTKQASSLLDRAVDGCRQRLKKNTSSHGKSAIATGLSTLAAGLPPAEREQLAGEIASELLHDYRAYANWDDRFALAHGFASLCACLPREKARELAEDVVFPALKEYTKESESMYWGHPPICELARWLTPHQREAVVTQLVDKLAGEFRQEKAGTDRFTLIFETGVAVRSLSTERAEGVLAGMEKFARNRSELMEIKLLRARAGKPPATIADTVQTAQLLADIDLRAWQMFKKDDTHTLEALCCGLTREELHRRKAFPAAAGGLVPPDSLPKPETLPPQVLVDLLKRPFVVREKRRAVLNALEFTYDRKFADLWEFVAFAEKEHPELDLLTPPKRPERK